MNTNSTYWGELFSHWPSDVPHRGIIVTAFNEQIYFAAFWISGDYLILERKTPDAQGARAVMLPYDQIVALKFVDVINPKHFNAVK